MDTKRIILTQEQIKSGVNLNFSVAITDSQDSASIVHTASIDIAIEAETVSALDAMSNEAAVLYRQRLKGD